MAIIIHFKCIKPELVDAKLVESFGQAVADEMMSRKQYGDLVHGFALTHDNLYFCIKFDHACLPISEDECKRSVNYIIREMDSLLDSINLGTLFRVSRISVEPQAGDKIFDYKKQLPKPTRNSMLLNVITFPDTLIPEKFICNISQMIIDNPVYINGKPEIKYNKAHLLFWLFQQNELIDPFRRIPISIADIINDHETQKAIKEFMTLSLENTLQTTKLVSEYKLSDSSALSLEKGLRRAAAEKKDNDLLLFIKRVGDVNKQDDNPKSKKTALHWATSKKNLTCVSHLLEAGADEEVQDASGKSPSRYAEEAKDVGIIKLFSDAAHRRRNNLATFFSGSEISSQRPVDLILSYLSTLKSQ